MKTENRLPSTPPKEEWHEYLSNLTTSEIDWLPAGKVKEEILKRLRDWQNRFEFYKNFQDKSFKKFNSWKKKNKLAREGKKLQKAFMALEELINTENTIKPENNYKNMRKAQEAAYAIVNIQLLKIEIAQLRMLEKAQNLKRNFNGISLTDLQNTLKAIREQSRLDIEKRARSELFSKEARRHNLNNAFSFFKSQEGKIHFTKHFRTTDKAADTFSLFGALNNFFSHVAAFVSSMKEALAVVASAIGAFLQYIPVINSIMSAIPILIHAAKTWIRNKSATKKTFATILVGVVLGSLSIVIAGLIVGGLVTVAAPFLAVGLMAIGTFVKHGYPWFKYLMEIRKRKAELIELAKTKEQLKHLKPTESFKLGPREQQFLMVKLEEAFLNNKLPQDTSLEELRSQIVNTNDNNFVELNKNLNIKELIRNEKENIFDLQTFLLKSMDQRELDIADEIKSLSVLEKRKRILFANGILAIIGVILLCIPTPPTLIIGASLLVVSAVIGVGIAFNLGTKIKNLFNRLFNSKGASADVASATNEPAPRNVFKLDSTAELNHDFEEHRHQHTNPFTSKQENIPEPEPQDSPLPQRTLKNETKIKKTTPSLSSSSEEPEDDDRDTEQPPQLHK